MSYPRENKAAAFPRPYSFNHKTYEQFPSQEGMSLRDYFAGMALQGLCANTGVIYGDHLCPEHPADCCGPISRAAYELADAMLNSRNKPPQ